MVANVIEGNILTHSFEGEGSSYGIFIPEGKRFNVSLLVPTAFSGTVTLQRARTKDASRVTEPDDYNTIKSFNSGVEQVDITSSGGYYRTAVLSGDYTSGLVETVIEFPL